MDVAKENREFFGAATEDGLGAVGQKFLHELERDVFPEAAEARLEAAEHAVDVGDFLENGMREGTLGEVEAAEVLGLHGDRMERPGDRSGEECRSREEQAHDPQADEDVAGDVAPNRAEEVVLCHDRAGEPLTPMNGDRTNDGELAGTVGEVRDRGVGVGLERRLELRGAGEGPEHRRIGIRKPGEHHVPTVATDRRRPGGCQRALRGIEDEAPNRPACQPEPREHFGQIGERDRHGDDAGIGPVFCLERDGGSDDDGLVGEVGVGIGEEHACGPLRARVPRARARVIGSFILELLEDFFASGTGGAAADDRAGVGGFWSREEPTL